MIPPGGTPVGPITPADPYTIGGSKSGVIFNPYNGYDGYGGGEDDYSWGNWPWGSDDNGGYGGGFTGGYFGGYGGGDGGSGWGGVLGGVAGGLALGGLVGGSGGSTAPRNLQNEIGSVTAMAPGLAGSTVGTNLQLSPLVTAGNLANFNYAVGGAGKAMRNAYNAANPMLTDYTANLQDYLNSVNALGAQNYSPTGYAAQQAVGVSPQAASLANAGPAAFTSAGSAAQASYAKSQAYLAQAQQAQAQQAAQQRAQGGPLLATLQNQAMESVGGVSPLQARQQQIAMGLLGGSGGDLTAQELRNVQQDTRGAFAARGLYDGNTAIGAEIMNSDAARRQRLTQNLGIAQGVDAAGQSQIGATRNFALGVQGQGQNLSQFNAGQGNQLGMFNVGQGNQTSQFNAGQANDVSKFNAGTQTQNSQFNSNLGAQVSLANMQAQNQMAQFNSGQQNNLAQYNAGLGAQNSQFNASAQNQNAQYYNNLIQSNNQFNANAVNNAQQFSAAATNQSNAYNATANTNYNNQLWTNAMQLGNFYQGQAQNPTAVGMGLMGNAPDYTTNLLQYGSDLYNTNYNGSVNQANSKANNNAALTTAGLNLLYNLYGRPSGGG